MKNAFKFLIGILVAMLAISASAASVDRGRWFCKECYLAPPATAMTASDLSEAWAFIKSTVNTQTGSRWIANEMITVCDGSACITLSFQIGCACWMPTGPTTKDNGKGYKNAQVDLHAPGTGAEYANVFYRIFFSTWSFINNLPKLLSPHVDITQYSTLSSNGFSPTLGTGFDLGAGGSSFAYQSDFAYGGMDAEVAEGFSSGGGGCHVDCPPVMQK